MHINKVVLPKVLLLYLLSGGSLNAGKYPLSPVIINTPDSSVHAFVITVKSNVKTHNGRNYYWYSKNSILITDGGYSGKLLHDQYTSYYANHNLKSQGSFRKGLKSGRWRHWYPNGKPKEDVHFSNGILHGIRSIYDSTGALTMRIYYRNGVRAGKTKIFSQGNTDTVIRYKNGVPRVAKSKKSDTTATRSVNRNDSLGEIRKKQLRQRDSLKPRKRNDSTNGSAGLFKRWFSHDSSDSANKRKQGQ